MSAPALKVEEWDELDELDETDSSDTDQWSLLDSPLCVAAPITQPSQSPVQQADQSSSNSIDSDSKDDEDEDLQLALALSLKGTDTTSASEVASTSRLGSNTLCWTGSVSSRDTFTAQWQVNLPAVADEPLEVRIWGERVFSASECDGDCVHRKVDLIKKQRSADGGLDYSIQVSHLRAPSEQGQYLELWRLRNILGHIVGPILEIKLDVTDADTHRRKRFRRGVTLGGNESSYEAEIINHGPLNRRIGSGIPTNTAFKYTWKLRNSGQTEWTPPFALTRVDADQSATRKTSFAITNEYRRMVTGAIAKNAIINVTLSGLDTGGSTGIQQQIWRLTSTSKRHVLAEALPLRLQVVYDLTDNPALGQFTTDALVEPLD